MSTTARLRSEAGYSIIELLVSSAIMITVTGAIFGLVNPSQGTSQTVPEVSDLQQRARVGSDVLFKEILMAGAGTYQGPVRSPLVNFFAPVLPRRTGYTAPDPYNVFKTDAITIAYIPNTYSQTTISHSMPPNSSEIKVNDQDNCPGDDQLCGFEEGMEVILFDSSGNFDTFVITQVQDSAGHLQHRGVDLSHEYGPGSAVTVVRSFSYFLDRNTNQLMQEGGGRIVPIADNVVDLRFDYFGDPVGPTSPKPTDAGTANCLYDATGALQPLPTLTATEGSLAPLTGSILEDGPWCGSGGNTYDADMLRLRKVRVSLRLQVGAAALRGANTLLFQNPGVAKDSARQVADYTVSFDVTPRNLNLTR
jgi:hypothetical protein